MHKPCKVIIAKFAEKQLRKLPTQIKEHIRSWAISIELYGIREIRRLPGYHDEPLKGDRVGQRSVRLNRSYRLIYEETESGELIVIGVKEINKHEY